MATEITLRPATMADAAMLLAWRNDSETRESSHNTGEVALANHLRWLEAVLANRARTLWVAELAGKPVGTVRVDTDSAGHELSWTVAPEARGAGIGKRMVAIAAERVPGPLRAEVKEGNRASARIAEAAGLRFVEVRDGVMYFSR